LFCVGSDLFEPNSFPSILLYRPNLWPKRSSSYRQGPVKRTMVHLFHFQCKANLYNTNRGGRLTGSRHPLAREPLDPPASRCLSFDCCGRGSRP
jgi:hypothetical protein